MTCPRRFSDHVTTESGLAGQDSMMRAGHRSPLSMPNPRFSASSARWLVAALLAGAAGVSLWLARTSNWTLREALRRWQFWSLETVFMLLLALTVANLPELV